jgi:peroxiredoxin
MDTMADRVAQLQGAMTGQLPDGVLSTFGAEQAALRAAGVPAGVAAPGDAMPDGQLLDVRGAPTTLAEAVGSRNAVVVFYRGAWCPYCNVTLRTYQNELVRPLAERGATLVAISPQKPDGSLTMQETNELTFTVLSDAGNTIAGKLGVLTEPNAETKAAQQKLGVDVAATNADGTAVIPMPTTVIADASGKIRWIDVHPDYTTRSEPAEILAAYDAAL